MEENPEQLHLGQSFHTQTAPEQTRTVKEHQRRSRPVESVDGESQNLFFDEEVVPVELVEIANPEVEGLREDEYEIVGERISHRGP